jgi:hypothetical protein
LTHLQPILLAAASGSSTNGQTLASEAERLQSTRPKFNQDKDEGANMTFILDVPPSQEELYHVNIVFDRASQMQTELGATR